MGKYGEIHVFALAVFSLQNQQFNFIFIYGQSLNQSGNFQFNS